jgi:hypothetical protein
LDGCNGRRTVFGEVRVLRQHPQRMLIDIRALVRLEAAHSLHEFGALAQRGQVLSLPLLEPDIEAVGRYSCWHLDPKLLVGRELSPKGGLDFGVHGVLDRCPQLREHVS